MSLPPEYMEMLNFYPKDDYPNDMTIHISSPLLTKTNLTMRDILANYPGRTIHDVAISASQNRDSATISYLLSLNEYLPIRWLMVYNVGDTSIRDLIYLSNKYRPVYHHTEETKINDDNYLILLDNAMYTGNLEVIEETISLYGRRDELLLPYLHTPISPIARKYIVEEGYVSIGDRTRCIIIDDPTCIDSLTSSEIEDVLIYDSISIFTSKVKEVDVTSSPYLIRLVHGKILSHLLSTTNDDHTIRSLLPRSSYQDLKSLINRDIRLIDVYIEIGKRGYFELLHSMSIRDVLLFITSIWYDRMVEEVHTYIEYTYHIDYTDIDLLEGAIINANVSLIRTLLSHLDRQYIDRAIHLSYQYHMYSPDILNDILSILE